MTAFTDKQVRDRFRGEAANGTITCARCLALARELGIPTKSIGPMLTEMDIRIVQCQLGCFL